MFITKVTYKNYRNVKEAEIKLEREVNVFQGYNAQGKTNLLEGIYYFACGKSFRGASDKELVLLGEDTGSVTLYFTDEKRERTHEVQLFAAEKKICRKEGIKIGKMSDFIGVFRAVLFSPEHLSIVKDGPAERRAFLDVAISQVYPAYLASLSKYKKLLTDRNALLKDPSVIGFDDMISVISSQMASEAAFISGHRDRYIKKLSEHVEHLIYNMTGGHEIVKMQYNTLYGEDEYQRLFMSCIEREIAAKTTLHGIQKDDIYITLNGLDSRVYASQGQQRSIALAMKLAEGEISKEICGEYPVFLFDDILSELDEVRRGFVLTELYGRQVIITNCTQIDAGKIFNVYKGRVSVDGKGAKRICT